MADSVAPLLETLRRLGIIEEKLLAELAGSGLEPRRLLDELVRRGQLTSYQAEELQFGRGQDLILGSYVMLDRLGEGGMGQVYQARHRRLDRIDAIKIIHPDQVRDARAVQRFQREAKAAARLAHPHVVAVYDADEVGGRHFIAMEYVPGTDLARLVQQSGPLSFGLACSYLRQAALGLEHIRECGLVHRDIKPQNLLVASKTNSIKVADLGLALLHAGPEQATASAITREGTIMGTPDFIAPEQASNSHQVDIRADLYSLGCSLYFLLTGNVPFPGGSMMEKLIKHQIEAPPSLEQVRPELPAGVVAIWRKLMAKSPAERYQSPVELAADLEPFARTVGTAQAIVAAAAQVGRETPVLRPTAITAPGAAAALPSTHLPAAESVTPSLSKTRAPRVSLWLTTGMVIFAVSVPLFLVYMAMSELSNPTTAASATVTKQTTTKAAKTETRPMPKVVTEKTIATPAPRRWDVSQTIRVSNQQVFDVAFFPDSKRVVVGDGSWDKRQPTEVKIWDLASGKETQVLPMPDPVRAVAVSPDGALVAAGCGAFNYAVGGEIKIWDWRNRKVRHALPGHADGTFSLAFHPDGKRLASCGADWEVKIWDVAGGQLLETLKGHTDAVQALAFSPDGAWLATGGNDKTVKLWRTADWKEIASLPTPYRGWVSDLGFSPDGKSLAASTFVTMGNVPVVGVWQVEPPKLIGDLCHESRHVMTVAFTPDGQSIVSGCAEGLIRFWDQGTLKLTRKLSGHEGDIFTVRFSPDGEKMVTVSASNELKIWLGK